MSETLFAASDASFALNKGAKKKSRKSQLEDDFAGELRTYGLPKFERQYIFHPTRKWRLDFAWPEHKIGVELHGGIFMPKESGAHNRGADMEKDWEKTNAAQLIGWRVFVFGPKALRAKKRLNQSSQALEFMWNLFKEVKRQTNG